MSYARSRLIFAGFVMVASSACSAGSEEAIDSSRAASLGVPGVPNAPDTQCNVVLRDIAVPENRGGVETNCTGASGALTCWVVFEGDLDVSSAAVTESDAPFVFYQSGTDPSWYQSAAATKVDGAGKGMQRYHFSLTHHTALQDEVYPTIQVIPFLQTTLGTRLFDHNTSSGNTVLDAENDWSFTANASTCDAPPPNAVATVWFNTGWTETTAGVFAQSGKLDVEYDLNRMPQCLHVWTDGVPAWNTEAYARFSPGNQLVHASVRGSYDATKDTWSNQAFDTDIPSDATSVALWFETSGDGCATSWDSDYGQNYVYSIQH